MSENVTTFNGSVPQNYEEYLGPLLFESFALDLASRVEASASIDVLELACGTGRLTKNLLPRLPEGSKLVATDLNADMIAVGKEKVSSVKLDWQTVDMLNMPYDDNSFDLAVCQFGVMLVPDPGKALQEIYRVLKKGGRILFSVWGDLEDNDLWRIGADVIKSNLNIDPIRQIPGPFSMQDEYEVLTLMKEKGFQGSGSSRVRHIGSIEEAGLAAKGFIRGLPVYSIITQRAPALLSKIEEDLANRLNDELGNNPMRTSLFTLVFDGQK